MAVGSVEYSLAVCLFTMAVFLTVCAERSGFTVPTDFRFVSIRKEQHNGVSNVIIRYQSTVKPAVYLDHPMGPSIEHEFGTVNIQMDHGMWAGNFLFILPECSITINLYENVDFRYENETPNARLHFTHGPDVVYEKGRDVTFKVSLMSDDIRRHMLSNDSIMEVNYYSVSVFYAEETANMNHVFEEYFTSDITSDDGLLKVSAHNGTEVILKVETGSSSNSFSPDLLTILSNAENNVSPLSPAVPSAHVSGGHSRAKQANYKGVIVLDVGTNIPCSADNSDTCIAGTVSITARVSFHSSEMENVFPPGSLIFITGVEQTDWSSKICYEAHYCYISCAVLGRSADFNRTVEIAKVNEDDTTTIMTVTDKSELMGFVTQADVTFEYVTLTDAGLYRCIARTPTTVTEKDILLTVESF